MSTEDDKDNQWHLDKKVPLTLIFAMLVQAAMVIWAVADIKKDVEVLKATVSVQAQRDATQDSSVREALTVIRQQYDLTNAKLDRLIERAIK